MKRGIIGGEKKAGFKEGGLCLKRGYTKEKRVFFYNKRYMAGKDRGKMPRKMGLITKGFSLGGILCHRLKNSRGVNITADDKK